ncbi:YitT family protein [Brevibacillus daliensis]|uniref:YitT family protein n=1 Tax=Brevibacillus daliensis TaxID=2892995 RepID=UPI001E313FFD|nr:YitT family protein [Brevibacillus daliensis]
MSTQTEASTQKKNVNLDIKKIIGELAGITVGCLIFAFGANALISAHHLLPGGITGISTLLYRLTGMPIGVLYFLLNVPLLILGYFKIGKKFLVYTIFAVIILSYFLSIIPQEKIWTDNALLGAIFGGCIANAGVGIVMRFGGSTGGTDILGRIVARSFQIPIGIFSLAINGFIVLASSYYGTPELAMYTIISMYVGAKTVDLILNHVDRISVTIITRNGEEVADVITQSVVGRGVTLWDASGAYTHSKKQVLMCVIVKHQWPCLKKIVLKADPKAFITVSPIKRIVGNFKEKWS